MIRYLKRLKSSMFMRVKAFPMQFCCICLHAHAHAHVILAARARSAPYYAMIMLQQRCSLKSSETSIRESVDSLCRDGTDTPMPPWGLFLKAHNYNTCLIQI